MRREGQIFLAIGSICVIVAPYLYLERRNECEQSEKLSNSELIDITKQHFGAGTKYPKFPTLENDRVFKDNILANIQVDGKVDKEGWFVASPNRYNLDTKVVSFKKEAKNELEFSLFCTLICGKIEHTSDCEIAGSSTLSED